MKVRGFDHVVVNTNNIDTLIEFYRDTLGMEILREEQFREGKVGFVSLRVSPETIIDLRPSSSIDRSAANVDHFCLVLEDTNMEELRLSLKSKGIVVDDNVHAAWGAQGLGQQFKFVDPDGNKVELRCYEAAGQPA